MSTAPSTTKPIVYRFFKKHKQQKMTSQLGKQHKISRKIIIDCTFINIELKKEYVNIVTVLINKKKKQGKTLTTTGGSTSSGSAV